MLNVPVHLFRVTVLFNPLSLSAGLNPITLVSDDFYVDEALNGRALSIPQGLSLIVFDLMQLPGGAASVPAAEFAGASTILWTNPDDPTGDPLPTPSAFQVQTFAPSHCNMLDFNTAKTRNFHPFTVNVTYNNVTYPQDPTIVNEPPVG